MNMVLRVFVASLLAIALTTLSTGCGDSAGNEEVSDAADGADDVVMDTGDDAVECPDVECDGVCCDPGESCIGGECLLETASCETGADCNGGELCERGTCVTECSEGEACGGVCCIAGQLCDTGALACSEACMDGRAPCNSECCGSNEACETGECRVQCGTDETRCGATTATETCCAADETCINDECQLDCGINARCGSQFNQICCADGEVCELGDCKTECSGTRCGANEELCCVGGELCLFDACLESQGPCQDNFDCPLDAFCETSVGQCILVEDDPNQCIFVPPVGQFQPEVQWHWDSSTAYPSYDQVMMTPIVINLTDDNGDNVVDENDIPDVAFGTFSGGGYNSAGVIRVASGDDGRELAASNARQFSVSSDLGAADVDLDGRAEIVVASRRGLNPKQLYALNLVPDGNGGYTLDVVHEITLANDYGNGYTATTAAFADLEGDNVTEVITQYGITDTLGTWSQRCEPPTGTWPHAAVADLNEDGTQEIIASGSIWDGQCQELAGGGGSRAAIADLLPDTGGDDMVPEIVWVRPATSDGTTSSPGTVEVWNVRYDAMTQTWAQDLVWETSIPMNQARIQSIYGWTCDGNVTHKSCNSGGGTPTIADFDNDGEPEIGVAARWYYIVLETNGDILWADADIKDYSSAHTGSSVFDFEGDGAAEVVYNDEEFLRIYKGSGSGMDMDGDGFNDADVLYSQPNPSGTLYEMPLIVDVDNDGNAEIVLAANNYAFPGVTGIRVFKDPLDNWVRTRRIWNQHTYHVTNIEENGTAPMPEIANWTKPGLNNYRQNVQPGGLFNAPNLAVASIATDETPCPNSINVEVTVENQGSLGVPAGVWVGVYAINLPAPDPRALLGRVQTTSPIPPGGSTVAIFNWDFSATLLPSGMMTTLALPQELEAIADDPPMAPGMNGDHNECVETDNTLSGVLVDQCGVN